ncbi:hypothetical protein Vretifemale_19258 [Volvox reticuliferus]|nr:hypothetical protein Vretifemale_19258 [Volvox reticuliferus]
MMRKLHHFEGLNHNHKGVMLCSSRAPSPCRLAVVRRQAMMAQHADGFIAMPGGFGTLEEFLEVMTWQQLGFHTKPVALLNVNGFFDPLLTFFQHAVQEGFVRPHYNTVIVSADPGELVQKMRAFKPPVSLVAAALNSTVPVGVDVSVSSIQAEQADSSGA